MCLTSHFPGPTSAGGDVSAAVKVNPRFLKGCIFDRISSTAHVTRQQWRTIFDRTLRLSATSQRRAGFWQ